MIDENLTNGSICEEEWQHTFRWLDNLASLQPNWDGEHAREVDRSLVDTARVWLKDLMSLGKDAPGAVYATTFGTIIMEWYWSPDEAIIAQVRTNGLVHVIERNSGKTAGVKVYDTRN